MKARDYDVIQSRNGYATNSPEMLIELRGLRRCAAGRSAYYAIQLGRILKSNAGDHEAPPRRDRHSVTFSHPKHNQI